MPNQRPLRIGVVTETYPPEINGVANTMRHLVDGLSRLGHKVFLVRPRQISDRGRRPPRRTLLVPGLPIPGYRGLRFGLPVYWRLRHLWLRTRPDVLYIATEGPLGHAALNAGQRGRIPVVTGFHTQFHQYSRHYGLGLLTGPIVNSLKHFHNRSDATLVPTSNLRSELGEAGFHNVHVFSRGVDTELFHPNRRSDALRAEWGCGPDQLVALYVGRIAAEKNIDLALRTMSALMERYNNVRCVLVGDGPERARLSRTHPECLFVGAKVGEELARHYASGDLFVFPSLTETFGNVVTEAMSSGVAVAAFDYAAAHEHIRNAENGLLTASGDDDGFVATAVSHSGDVEALRRMGQAARAQAETLSWHRVIEGLELRLRELIKRRKAGDDDATRQLESSVADSSGQRV
jgi:glycosyltransferase involved in cell wall biosynthesis